MGDAPRQAIGPYLLLHRLSLGDLTESWLAVRMDEPSGPDALERPLYFVSLLRDDLADLPEIARHMGAEHRALERLRHPRVPPLLHHGSTPRAFGVYPYVPGLSLRELLGASAEQGVPLTLALAIVEGVAATLEDTTFVHGRSHARLAPSKIRLALDGRIFVAPSTSALPAVAAENPRPGGSRAGGFYMAPEQILGRPADPRSTVFTLGVILHELIGGRHPFVRATQFETLEAMLGESYPPLAGDGGSPSHLVAPVVSRCLKREAGQRFASPGEVASELRTWLGRLGAPTELELARAIATSCHRRFTVEARRVAALARVDRDSESETSVSGAPGFDEPPDDEPLRPIGSVVSGAKSFVLLSRIGPRHTLGRAIDGGDRVVLVAESALLDREVSIARLDRAIEAAKGPLGPAFLRTLDAGHKHLARARQTHLAVVFEPALSIARLLEARPAPLPALVAIQIALQVARGLERLSPELAEVAVADNVFLTPGGEVRLLPAFAAELFAGGDGEGETPTLRPAKADTAPALALAVLLEELLLGRRLPPPVRGAPSTLGRLPIDPVPLRSAPSAEAFRVQLLALARPLGRPSPELVERFLFSNAPELVAEALEVYREVEGAPLAVALEDLRSRPPTPVPLPIGRARTPRSRDAFDRDGEPGTDPDGPTVVELYPAAKKPEADGRGMVRIPAGAFLFGPTNEPRTLGAYYIDQSLVTNAEYLRFVEATKTPPPPHWAGARPLPEEEACPVVGVSAEQAAAYAAFMKKRLPSEEEWEKAARGPRGLPFPWGPEFDPTRCPVLYKLPHRLRRPIDTVGKYSPRGDSVYGVRDFCWVWEWTSAQHEFFPGTFVVRGGPWRNQHVAPQLTNRSMENEPALDVGFRCAADVEG